MVKPYFSNIQEVILKNISEANETIKAAIAWFTNEEIFNALIGKLNDGIEIELIIRDDYINNSENSLKWKKFINARGKIYFTQATHKLHHKYCIIDRGTVITGSYNWTYLAEKVNQENIVVITNESLMNDYIEDFNTLKRKSQFVNEFTILNERQTNFAPVEEKAFINEELRLIDEIKEESKQTDDRNKFESSEQSEYIDKLLNIAEHSYKNKNYRAAQEALKLLEKITQDEPKYYELWGWIMFREKNYKDQIRYVEKGLQLDINNPDLYNLLGIAYEYLGNQRMSLENYDKAIKFSPDDSVTTIYCNKIMALIKFGLLSIVDKESPNLLKVATNIIRGREKALPGTIMKAYLSRGYVRIYRNDRVRDAIKAREYFYKIPEIDRDYHDLEDINFIMNL